MAGMTMFEARRTSANQRNERPSPQPPPLPRIIWAVISKHSEKVDATLRQVDNNHPMEWLATVETCHWITLFDTRVEISTTCSLPLMMAPSQRGKRDRGYNIVCV
jgi:hypothetical protein